MARRFPSAGKGRRSHADVPPPSTRRRPRRGRSAGILLKCCLSPPADFLYDGLLVTMIGGRCHAPHVYGASMPVAADAALPTHVRRDARTSPESPRFRHTTTNRKSLEEFRHEDKYAKKWVVGAAGVVVALALAGCDMVDKAEVDKLKKEFETAKAADAAEIEQLKGELDAAKVEESSVEHGDRLGRWAVPEAGCRRLRQDRRDHDQRRASRFRCSRAARSARRSRYPIR